MPHEQSLNTYVILGAGPGGFALGWRLSKSGESVVVLEKEETTGGLAKTFETQGFYFDLGPHILHPKNRRVSEFIQRILGDELTRLRTTQQILFRGRYVNYPLRGIRALMSLPWYLIGFALIDFVWTRLKLTLYRPASEPSFQEWITNRFGRLMYGTYFGPYAEKVWKIPGRELSSYVAQKRVPVISIRDQIRLILGIRPKVRHSEDGHLEKFYSRRGVGRLCDKIAEEMAAAGGRVVTSADVAAIQGTSERITSVVYRRGSQRHEQPVQYLISTIPLCRLVPLLDFEVPSEVRSAAAQLDYCSQRLLYLMVSSAALTMPSFLYFSDKRIPFNRVTNVGAFSPDCVPPGRSALCVEYTCRVGDSVWTCSDEELAQDAVRILEKNGILRHQDVQAAVSRHLEYSYPRFRVGFEKRLATVFAFLRNIQNLKSFGRHGSFSYANVDDVIEMAFEFSDSLLKTTTLP